VNPAAISRMRKYYFKNKINELANNSKSEISRDLYREKK
jgi:hypothetical protein